MIADSHACKPVQCTYIKASIDSFHCLGKNVSKHRHFLWPLTIIGRLLEIRKKTPWKKYTLLLHKYFVCPRDLELVPWTCFFQSSRLWSEGQQQWTPFLTGITLKEKWESVPKYFYETNKINPIKHLNINQYWGIENNFNWSRFALFFNDPLN